jgi:hypothetical protein
MNRNLSPLVLELDDSLRALDYPGLVRIGLGDWQDGLRFGCTGRVWRAFSAHLDPVLPAAHGVVLTGSGDFHHLSALLIARAHRHAGLRVLVCDNHPDNMRFPFGIHCGSWVAHVARMPHVARVDVAGICSPDVAWPHAWENHLGLLLRGKVRYWTIGARIGWTRLLGLREVVRDFDDAADLVRALLEEISRERGPLYLSIDKDVLHESVARTHWDQGQMELDGLLRFIDAAAPRLVGGDITGEISVFRYRTRWKRWLSALDGQSGIVLDEPLRWQRRQNEVNVALLDAFSFADLA